MSKGKKRCYFCGTNLTNQNRTQALFNRKQPAHDWLWVDSCHSCKAKEGKKP